MVWVPNLDLHKGAVKRADSTFIFQVPCEDTQVGSHAETMDSNMEIGKIPAGEVGV
jgi:hypothetical protein